MASPRVYTLGRLIVDLYGVEIGVDLTRVERFAKYVGGSAANTAVGLARLGVATGMIARVGHDPFGRYLLAALAREGVDTRMTTMDPALPTGLAFAALRPPDDSEVAFYGVPNANATLSAEDLHRETLSQAKFLVVGGTALASPSSSEAVLAALDCHRRAGGVNILDVDWRPAFWVDPAAARGVYRRALALTDLVLSNEPELTFVAEGREGSAAAEHLYALGVGELVAKRGAAGVDYYSPRQQLSCPAFSVPVLNTLGAGDGFAAGWVAALADNVSVPQALRFASAVAAIVVSRHGCSAAMPTRTEVSQFLARQSTMDAAQKGGEAL